MSESKVDQSVQPETAQSSTDGDATAEVVVNRTPEEYAKKLADVSAENKKFRQSYVQYKRELEEAQDRLRQMQESTMQEQGKFKDLYEKTAKELSDERAKRQGDRAQWTGHVVASRFAAEAVKAGCLDPNALIKIANADGLLNLPELVSDESFEVNAEALQNVVQQAKKANSILFGKPTPAARDGVPKTNTTKQSAPDLSKMKIEDLVELAKNMN